MSTYRQLHSKFHGGIFPDVPGYLVPEGGMSNAEDVLFDKLGIMRKRAGSGSLGGSAADYLVGDICTFKAGSPSITDRVIGLAASGSIGDNPQFYICDTTSGDLSAVAVGGAAGSIAGSYTVGKMFMHLGFLCVSIRCPEDPTWNWLMIYGGASDTSTLYEPTAGGVGTVTAGSNEIHSPSSTDFVTHSKVGDIVVAKSADHAYIGRVVAVNSITSLQVEPTPTQTFSPLAAKGISTYPSLIVPAFASYNARGGDTACSWENRVLIGNTVDANADGGAASPHRISWSMLPNEHTGQGSITVDGLIGAFREAHLANNFIDTADGSPVKVIRPVGAASYSSDGQLAVFGDRTVNRVSGDLVTEVEDAATGTFGMWPVSAITGSISEAATLSTSQGTIFPSTEGVFIYNGNKIVNLMDGRCAKQYQAELANAAVATGLAVLGACIFRNYYLISLSSNISYMLDLDTLDNPVWTRVTGQLVQAGCQDPFDLTIFYASKWWLQSSTAPNGFNVYRIDSILRESSDGIDQGIGAGALVSADIWTPAYGEADMHVLKRFTRAAYEYRSEGSDSTVTVSVGHTLEPADDVYVEVGELPRNERLEIASVTDLADVSITITTTGDHGYTAGDRVIIEGVGGNTNANGASFVSFVLSPTEFVLAGKSANDDYTSGGVVWQPDAKEFPITPLLPRAFAIQHKIHIAGGTRFEMYGIRNSYQPLRQGRVS